MSSCIPAEAAAMVGDRMQRRRHRAPVSTSPPRIVPACVRRPRDGRCPTREEGGFTLVELLVTMVLALMVGLVILMTLWTLTGVFHSQETRMLNQDDARTAVNQMARFIRMATSSADNMSTQSDAVATAQPQNMEFYCDIDGDRVAEKVRYYLDGTNLRMQTSTAVWVTGSDPHYEYPEYETNGVVVQDGIRNETEPVFTYYKYDGDALVAFSPTTAEQKQAVVTVSLFVRVNERPDLAQSDVLLATDAQIRQRYEGGLEE
jgi:type II secretory pathway pseudopilin PulG